MKDIGIYQGESESSIGSIRPSTMTETLEQKRGRLKMQLADVEAALAALKAHPEVEAILNLISKVR